MIPFKPTDAPLPLPGFDVVVVVTVVDGSTASRRSCPGASETFLPSAPLCADTSLRSGTSPLPGFDVVTTLDVEDDGLNEPTPALSYPLVTFLFAHESVVVVPPAL